MQALKTTVVPATTVTKALSELMTIISANGIRPLCEKGRGSVDSIATHRCPDTLRGFHPGVLLAPCLPQSMAPSRCLQLQSPNLDLHTGVTLMTALQNSLQTMRSDETFNTISDETKVACTKIDVSIPEDVKINVDTKIPEDYFRIAIAIPFYDDFISQPKERFSKHKTILSSLYLLIPKMCLKSPILESDFSIYSDFINVDELPSELKLWKRKWIAFKDVDRPHTAVEALNYCNPELFANIHFLLKVLATLPVSTATPERTFSTLKRVKTFLRNSTGQERLTGLALLSVHRDVTVNPDEVLNQNQSYNNYVESLTTKNSTLWKVTKSLLRLNQPTPLRNEDNSWVTTNIDKANILAQHLENSFSPYDIQPSHTQLKIIEKYLDAPLSMSMPAKPTSPDEINTIIKKILTKKSPGHDLITNYIVKNLPRKAIVYISHLYNAILRLSFFPNTWKHSIVILILKPNKPPENPASYRSISLLATFSKIIEKILLKRLIPLATEANIIPHTQFSFRAHHSTIHQLHRTVDKISNALEKKEFCPTVFLDVSQAFDRV
ncbi:hypothetical protein QTP88_014171 [Uroleucon formosanum]